MRHFEVRRVGSCLLLVSWLTVSGVVLATGGRGDYGDDSSFAVEYREPDAAVTALLTATKPPEPLPHARSSQVALLYREPVIQMSRLARPRLGLAGYQFDPQSGTSGVEALVIRVEVVSAVPPVAAKPIVWVPSDGALLDFVHFSPDGRTLSAVSIGDGPARLAFFDIATSREWILDAPINAAWGDPCHWIGDDELLCRVEPESRGDLPVERPVPTILEHFSEAVPVRTYANLLENDYEDELFDYWFGTGLARVDLDGRTQRVPGIDGLIYRLDPSPDGSYAVIKRLLRPYSRLVPARRFPSSIEVWDLVSGERLYASRPSGFGVEEDDRDEDPRRTAWRQNGTNTLGFIEKTRDAEGSRIYRWSSITAPFDTDPVEVVTSPRYIKLFGWTTEGTPWFATRGDTSEELRFYVVTAKGAEVIWTVDAAGSSDSSQRAVRLDGFDGPVLELNRSMFLAGDGLSDEGPQPFLDVFDLETRTLRRAFTADPGVYEVVLAVLDPEVPSFITSRETETEPPNLFVHRGAELTPLTDIPDPYPQLADTTRRVLRYQRADGVELSGTLYLPAGYREGDRLPTLLWIYPYEFSDREQAEQLDLRVFRYHRVKGPSPLAAVVAGYAVLLNPTVPIMLGEGAMTDDYLPQLVASSEAAVDYLVELGVTDPERVAVGGRSYGAFSTANLLIHSDYFAAGIALSGAYNRTLTPFGFQHERRSFWEATEFYTSVSPFFHADEITSPILLVHGGDDANPGTPPIQAWRFFHALVGEGVSTRYVELPFEGHHYWARESVLLATAEMLDWLDRTIGPNSNHAAGED